MTAFVANRLKISCEERGRFGIVSNNEIRFHDVKGDWHERSELRCQDEMV